MTSKEKFRQTMIKKHGSEEAWKAWNRENSRRGGKARVPKGFAADPEKAAAAGRKSGVVRSKHVENSDKKF